MSANSNSRPKPVIEKNIKIISNENSSILSKHYSKPKFNDNNTILTKKGEIRLI